MSFTPDQATPATPSPLLPWPRGRAERGGFLPCEGGAFVVLARCFFGVLMGGNALIHLIDTS